MKNQTMPLHRLQVENSNGEVTRMNCTVKGCPGEYEERRVNQAYRVDGKLMVVSDIPVESCPVCGDVLMSPLTAQKIENLLQNHGPTTEAAPVYRLAS